ATSSSASRARARAEATARHSSTGGGATDQRAREGGAGASRAGGAISGRASSAAAARASCSASRRAGRASSSSASAEGALASHRAARVGDAQPGQRGLVVLPGARQGARVEIGLERRLFGPGAGARQETARAFHVAGTESEARRQRVRDAEADRPRRLRRIH